jgi:hypothetical protein
MSFNATVYALASDSSGNLYAGGYFTTAGGVTANYIAKWNGTQWSSLGTGMGMDTIVQAIAFDSSDNVYVTGTFLTANGVTVNMIAKWNGTQFSALGNGISTNQRFGGYGLSFAVDSSDNLYVGGSFNVNEGPSNAIAKWNTTSSAWEYPFGSGMTIGYSVYSLAFDSNDNLYAGGFFFSANGVTANHIAKWNGTQFSALGSGTNNTVRALAVDSSGNLYIGGDFTTANGVTVNRIAKWNGTQFSALGTGMNNGVNSLAIDSSGNLYAGGYFTTAGGIEAFGTAKWNGSSWEKWIDVDSTVFAIHITDPK